MKNRPHLIPALIVAIMLLVAVAPLPYGYYQFLRWVVSGVAIFIAVKGYTWKQTWATWLFGAVAVMFNPILPIDLTREIWQPIDLAGVLLFSSSILLLREPPAKSIVSLSILFLQDLITEYRITIALGPFLMLAGIGLLFASAEIAGSIVFVIGFAVLVLPFAFDWKMGSNRLWLIIAIVWLIIAIVWLIIAGINVITSNPISALKYQWRDDFKGYNAIPTRFKTSPLVEVLAERKQFPFTRSQYLVLNPDIAAKLFIVGDIDSLSSQAQGDKAIQLMKENKLTPADIPSLKADQYENDTHKAMRLYFEKQFGVTQAAPAPPQRLKDRLDDRLKQRAVPGGER